MRIWYLNHFASTPDQQSTGAYYLMEGLAECGYDVTVFASGFNYYLRNDKKMQGKWLLNRERVGKIEFCWLRTFPTQGRIFTRFLNMISYSKMAFMVGLFPKHKPDVVMGTCPHPLAGLSAWLLAKWHGAKFVYEIRDIWPESMTEDNHISEHNILMRMMMWLQLFLYRRAFLLTSVIPGFGDYLKTKGIERFNFLWIPNGITIDKQKLPAPSGGPESKTAPFNIYYFGGHSKHQALDTVLDAAALLQKNDPALPIRFTLIGEGTEKPRLQEKAKAMGLTNLAFHPAIPRSAVMQKATEADCFLAHNRPIPILRFGGSMNKICDFMLGARPIINGSSASNDPIGETRSGITITAMQPQQIVDAVKAIYAMSPAERMAMGARAQAYAVETFDSKRLAQTIDRTLKSAA